MISSWECVTPLCVWIGDAAAERRVFGFFREVAARSDSEGKKRQISDGGAGCVGPLV